MNALRCRARVLYQQKLQGLARPPARHRPRSRSLSSLPARGRAPAPIGATDTDVAADHGQPRDRPNVLSMSGLLRQRKISEFGCTGNNGNNLELEDADDTDFVLPSIAGQGVCVCVCVCVCVPRARAHVNGRGTTRVPSSAGHCAAHRLVPWACARVSAIVRVAVCFPQWQRRACPDPRCPLPPPRAHYHGRAFAPAAAAHGAASAGMGTAPAGSTVGKRQQQRQSLRLRRSKSDSRAGSNLASGRFTPKGMSSMRVFRGGHQV